MKHWFLASALVFLTVPACGGDDDGGGSGGTSGSGATGGGGTAGAGATGGGGQAGSGGTTSTGGQAGSGGTTSTGGQAGAGGTSTGGQAGSGGSTGGSGGTDGGAACNSLVNDGSDISETQESGTPPTMTGGTIPDGTYVLTARKDWQGSCNCTRRTKFVVSGGGKTWQAVTRGDSGPDQFFTIGASTSANNLTLTWSCPAGQNLNRQYTVTSTNPVELQIYTTSDQALEVFTKQ